ncbi:MAG: Rrf2 family transcriptional regulator [Pseudomonadota bacterium]
MKRNGRLALALHTLSHMASDPERTQTSADIAQHAGTNAVVVRRVLGRLRDAKLLHSEKGHAGGWRLARNPDDISLADVYLALDERTVDAVVDTSSLSCAIEHALHDRVSAVMADVEKTLVERLGETTIADICSAPLRTA